jgi:hypothetical protein
MMMAVIRLVELRWVHQFRKLVEVEHSLVLAVFTVKRDVLTEVHVPKVISDKAAVAALDALSVCSERFG